MTNSKAESLGKIAWEQLKQNKLALWSGIIVLLIALACFLSPWLPIQDYALQDRELGATPPSAEHWLGTDTLGRDMLSRVLYGGQISFKVGLIATFTALLIGVSYGIISGYCGGNTDRVMMRIVDILYPLPFTIFVILLLSLFGRDIRLIYVAIGAVEWLAMARIIRGEVLSLKKKAFVEASLSLGQSHSTLLVKHLLPNLLGTIIVYATLTIPNVMLLESFISFLGLGVQPPMTSWGDLIKNGADSMEEYPWLLIVPALFFSITLFSLNFLGDGLRDALDPRSSKK
jgi:oligopeptide transport system permease protein